MSDDCGRGRESRNGVVVPAVVNRRKPPIFRLAADKMVLRCFRSPSLGHSRGDGVRNRVDLASGGHDGLASWRGIRYV
jgi:hypothetical protein